MFEEMIEDFILQTFIDEDFVWRITGNCICRLNIPREEDYDWSLLKEANGKAELLEHKGIVEFISVVYSDIEADEV